MRITADTGVCIGAGQCLLTAPELFDQDEEGTVVVLVPNPSAGQAPAARQAEAACPSRAIRVDQDDPTGVVQAPPEDSRPAGSARSPR